MRSTFGARDLVFPCDDGILVLSSRWKRREKCGGRVVQIKRQMDLALGDGYSRVEWSVLL